MSIPLRPSSKHSTGNPPPSHISLSLLFAILAILISSITLHLLCLTGSLPPHSQPDGQFMWVFCAVFDLVLELLPTPLCPATGKIANNRQEGRGNYHQDGIAVSVFVVSKLHPSQGFHLSVSVLVDFFNSPGSLGRSLGCWLLL